MSQRKLIRPSAAEPQGGRGARRKQVPPEQTNAEEFYYLKQMAAKTPMVVMLTNDEELRGWIEWYDKNSLKLNRIHEPNLLIPKHNIRYMFKEEELKRVRKRERALAGARGPAPSPEPDASEVSESDDASDD